MDIKPRSTAIDSALHPAVLTKRARIFVAGHRGLVGSAILRRLQSDGFADLVVRTHAELDLANQSAVESFFSEIQPKFVFLCAAKVGGIGANVSSPAEFIQQNVAIQTNVIHESWKTGVQRLLFMGSNCIYPRDCPQPIREEYLLSGPLEWTNRPYAIAKIAGIEMCWAYNRQYGTHYLAAMPTNLYGPGDNFDLETSHVAAAVVRRLHEAKQANQPSVTLWGTGKPRREFLYSDDLADAVLYLIQLPSERYEQLVESETSPPIINIGCGEDMSIREFAEIVKEVSGYRGEVIWDSRRPDGTPRKLLDISRLTALGWRPRVGLREGLVRFYQQYLNDLAGTHDRQGIATAPRASV
jgi:GDP-L-fucose synthase